eukprot:scaffold231608_cov28-Tisochrysis_lutea.AAC.3
MARSRRGTPAAGESQPRRGPLTRGDNRPARRSGKTRVASRRLRKNRCGRAIGSTCGVREVHGESVSKPTIHVYRSRTFQRSRSVFERPRVSIADLSFFGASATASWNPGRARGRRGDSEKARRAEVWPCGPPGQQACVCVEECSEAGTDGGEPTKRASAAQVAQHQRQLGVTEGEKRRGAER